MIILIVGPSGIGKSTTLRQLEPMLPEIVFLDLDRITAEWRTDRYALPSGRTLDWGCNGHIATAWHNISAPRMMCWSPIPRSERLRLFIQCIQVTPKADTILDPFMGTGDVLIAAIRLRKKFVGIELDKHRCDHAVNRIQEFKKSRS